MAKKKPVWTMTQAWAWASQKWPSPYLCYNDTIFKVGLLARIDPYKQSAIAVIYGIGSSWYEACENAQRNWEEQKPHGSIEV